MKAWECACLYAFLRHVIILVSLVIASSCGSNPPRFMEFDPDGESAYFRSQIRMYEHKISGIRKKKQVYLQKSRKLMSLFFTHKHEGCFLRKSLKSLVLEVDLKNQPHRFVGTFRNTRNQGGWGKRTYSFRLAEDISTEVATSGFVDGGVLFKGFQDKFVRDISYIHLLKNGVSMQTVLSSSQFGCGLLWLSSCEMFDIYESRLWRMKALKLKANNTVIYSRDDLSHLFSSESLEWKDDAIEENSSYKHILQKRDCLADDAFARYMDDKGSLKSSRARPRSM